MVWEAFLWYWLDENRPTVSLCYRKTVNWTEQFYPELVDLIPTERSFRRHIENDVKYAVKVLMRDGEKAFNDRCLPYMMRMYDKLEANECWIADNHTFDIQSYDDEGKIHRLYLTAFLDSKDRSAYRLEYNRQSEFAVYNISFAAWNHEIRST